VDYEVIRKLSRTAPWPYPENGVEEYLENVILPNQGIARWTWGIFLRNQPENLIGCVDLWKNGNPENRGFWLGRKFWNKGIMTEAVYPIIDFAFNTVGFEHLIFSNAVDNIGSRKIKEKTGCELIDIRQAEFVDPVFTEQEIWKLSLENWNKHKLSNPIPYVKFEN
jgi:RimJ/RimL family protein N-acetyltransferase